MVYILLFLVIFVNMTFSLVNFTIQTVSYITCAREFVKAQNIKHVYIVLQITLLIEVTKFISKLSTRIKVALMKIRQKVLKLAKK